MTVIVLLIVAGGLVAGGFLGAFLWAVFAGQFDDIATPPVRMLFDDQTRERDREHQQRLTNHTRVK